MKEQTLILTLEMEEAQQHFFSAQRAKYFPKYCNYLEAHITLFHKLPDNLNVEKIIQEFSFRNPIDLDVTAIDNIGNGVAYIIKSAELQELHMAMQKALTEYLIPQDKNILWPHITIQNKVTAFKAKKTSAFLQKNFEPFSVKAIGITSWIYLGGPWKKKATYLFQK